MQITYINNDGAGFADRIEIEDGTTIQQLFTQRIPHGSPGDYLIRVNRQPTTSDYVLQPGDRVSMTPTKIEGAKTLILDHQSLTSTPKEFLWEPVKGSTVCTSQES